MIGLEKKSLNRFTLLRRFGIWWHWNRVHERLRYDKNRWKFKGKTWRANYPVVGEHIITWSQTSVDTRTRLVEKTAETREKDEAVCMLICLQLKQDDEDDGCTREDRNNAFCLADSSLIAFTTAMIRLRPTVFPLHDNNRPCHS